MTDEQRRTVLAVAEWLRVRAEARGDKAGRLLAASLEVNADHSALLERLLEGRQPLPEPPPRAYSYPWYSLIEDGQGYAMEVWRRDDIDAIVGMPSVVVEQSRWDLVSENGAEDWTIRWPGTSYTYRVRRNPDGCPDNQHTPYPAANWLLTKDGGSDD